MEIKKLRLVLTWHLKDTDRARILEDRQKCYVSIDLLPMRARRNDSGWNLKGCYSHFPPTRARASQVRENWKFWEPWAGSMLVVLLPRLWFWIGNHDWHNCFWMSLWLFVGWTLTGPKKASKSTILYNKLNKEKLLVDVTNLATCWTKDYEILFEVLGTLGGIYVSSPAGFWCCKAAGDAQLVIK